MQYGAAVGINSCANITWVYFKRFIVTIFAIVIAPIALFLAPPFFCAYWGFRIFFKIKIPYLNCLLALIGMVLGFGLGLAANVVVVPVAVVIGIPSFIIFQIYGKYKMRQKAKDRLKIRIE